MSKHFRYPSVFAALSIAILALPAVATAAPLGGCAAFTTIYVDDSWVGTSAFTDPDGAGPATSFGCDSFALIQQGVTAAPAGGTVLVRAGTYNEGQVLIQKSLTVTGAGAANTIIDGGNAAIASAGLVRIDVPVTDTGNVSFSEFTLTNPGLTGASRYHMFAKQLAPATSIVVFNLTISGVNTADYGFYSDRARGPVEFHHNTLTNNAFNPILIERPESSTNVHHNIISGHASTAYFGMTYSANDVTAEQRITDNVINGAGSAISLNGGFGASTGRYTNVRISDNTITGLAATRIGIALNNGAAAGNGANGVIEDAIVLGNVITGSGAATSRGVRLTGQIVDAVITNNDVRNLARCITVELVNGHSATGTAAHFNNLVNCSDAIFSTAVVAIDAENNWFGCNAGPPAVGCGLVSGTGAASVDTTPRIVFGASVAPTPIAPFGTTTLTADIRRNSDGIDVSATGIVPAMPVIFSATEGTMSPASGMMSGGTATSTFTSTSGNSGTACATVDNELQCATVGVSQQADLGITKTNGTTAVNPNGNTVYTIVASNAGPSNAPGSTVTDMFPASLACSWTCTASVGASCTLVGSGDIVDTVNLPLGSSVTYTATCTIASNASGALINTATVAATAPVTDPTGTNNAATDTDTVSAAGAITITPGSTDFGTVAVGDTSDTRIVTLRNSGGSPVQVLSIGAALAPFSRVGGSCASTPFTLAVGGECTLDYTFTPTTTGPAAQSITVVDDSPGTGSFTLQGIGGQELGTRVPVPASSSLSVALLLLLLAMTGAIAMRHRH